MIVEGCETSETEQTEDSGVCKWVGGETTYRVWITRRERSSSFPLGVTRVSARLMRISWESVEFEFEESRVDEVADESKSEAQSGT